MIANVIVKCNIYNKVLNRILLLQRSVSDDVGPGTWENGGGNVEDGESLEEAVYREIREETGITDLKIGRIAYVSVIESKIPLLLIVYMCETETETVKLSPEHQAYAWADEEKCRQLLPGPILDDFENNNVFDILN